MKKKSRQHFNVRFQRVIRLRMSLVHQQSMYPTTQSIWIKFDMRD